MSTGLSSWSFVLVFRRGLSSWSFVGMDIRIGWLSLRLLDHNSGRKKSGTIESNRHTYFQAISMFPSLHPHRPKKPMQQPPLVGSITIN
ncbi:hypothetical protein MJO28_016154 [Puccinia striiformis f. sp. tritici]|uniref:Uncharacterized protein n=1 Tax=Puccinia striiformis f. sp. tritici TaxID=168172 RepID=A0ACC0DQN8_9BASI|nr:hypothetical protein MJO28_016154 [Puccinia striiformis f. sp. tritici]